jgi:predicted transcriptional regulator
MLHFLRRIRRSLINSGSTRKYALYAVGEVLLVMIGILLALQVNRWNENNIKTKAENEALIDLKKEFDDDQTHLDRLIRIRLNQEKQFRNYLNLITDPNYSISEKISAEPLRLDVRLWGATNTVLNSLVNTGGIV